MQYKVLTYKDNGHGRRALQKDINKLAKNGWRLTDQESREGKYGVGKTLALGVVFLPLALAGRKKGKLSVTLEKED